MEIRRASSKDAAKIRELIAGNPNTLRQDHLPRWREFFVATEKRQIVGCAALVIYSKRLAEIRSLAVAEGFQKQGIAARLVEACNEHAKREEVEEILAITGAKELFERKGFGTFRGEKFALLRTVKS